MGKLPVGCQIFGHMRSTADQQCKAFSDQETKAILMIGNCIVHAQWLIVYVI